MQARRRTATLDEMLYVGNDEQVPVLNTVPETPDESTAIVSKIPPVMSMSAPATTVVVTSSDGTLMPPPKLLPPRQTSASR